ncbi:MAG: S8 family peptidase [Planctomycetota bacterium]
MAAKKRVRTKRGSGSTGSGMAAGDSGRLIFVHGIGAQEPAPRLKLLWDVALFGADTGEQSRMAYWADILHPASATAGTTAQGLREEDGIDLQRALEQRGLSLDHEEVAALVNGLLNRFDLGRPVGPRARILPLPRFLRRPLARAFLEVLVADTAAYFFRPTLRKRIRQRLADALPADDTPITLVSHSQGTIIALEVLAERAKTRPVSVREWVTLGSPLGIREVQDFLSCELRVPEGVAKWTNFADPLDPVAFDKRLGNDFEPFGFVEDHLIVNERTKWLNPHSSLGYLSNATVRKVVAASVRRDAMAQFVVARDVARLLGEVQERLPVLIEVLEPGYPALGEDAARRQAIERREMRDTGGLSLAGRVAAAAARLEAIVAANSGEGAVEQACVDELRRFVAARLTASEILEVTDRHAELRVYRVWKNSVKRKLVSRSVRVVQADAAWASYAAMGDGIEWAVLDTGVRSDHPHFADHVVAAVWDCTRKGRPVRLDVDGAVTTDVDGHGTHVAGIIAGQHQIPGGRLMRGMAPRARLHVYKVLDDQGRGEDAWIIKALDHVAALNDDNSKVAIHGLNLSLGGPFDSTVYGCGFSPVCMELRRLWRDGTLVVVACGNEGKVEVETGDGEVELNSPMSIGDPANLEDCIAVGSVHADKPHLYGISSFSSRGPTADGRLKPDVVAPGERIESCNAGFSHKAGKLYREESGTSMAAPHVSGLLAAFLSVRREFVGRPDEVKELLLRTCTDLARDRYHQGRGIPNLMKMLLEA